VNFPFICSHITTAFADGAYVSLLKHFSASSGSPSFCHPLSRLGHEWTLICLVCTDCSHFICLRSWLVTVCDIWPVFGVSSIMNSNCGTGPYLPSWAFVSKSSFNGVPVAQTLVSNEDHCFPFVLSLSVWPLSFGTLVLVIHMLSTNFPYAYWVSNCHCI